jgi:hypothetical protein
MKHSKTGAGTCSCGWVSPKLGGSDRSVSASLGQHIKRAPAGDLADGTIRAERLSIGRSVAGKLEKSVWDIKKEKAAAEQAERIAAAVAKIKADREREANTITQQVPWYDPSTGGTRWETETMTIIREDHCQNCGSTDNYNLSQGDQGYTACCNEPVVSDCRHDGCGHYDPR